MHDELLKLEGPPKLGESYHVKWASTGVMGVCTAIYSSISKVELKRPKTKQPFKNLIPWSDLRHTRKQEHRIREGESPYPDRTHDPRHHKRMKKFKLL